MLRVFDDGLVPRLNKGNHRLCKGSSYPLGWTTEHLRTLDTSLDLCNEMIANIERGANINEVRDSERGID